MAINTVNGKNAFDPSKRIRAAIGEEFAENVKVEAIERLSQAMASNGIRKRDDYIEEDREEENDMRLRDILRNKTTHTNGVNSSASATDIRSAEERLDTRRMALEETQNKLNEMLSKKKFVESSVKAISGFGIKATREENLTNLVNTSMRNISAVAVNDAMETTFRLNDPKYIGISAAISTGVDFATNTIFSGNKTSVNKIFNPDSLTATESKNVEKVIMTERFKYGAEHALATVVLPSAVKFGINKVTSNERFRDNKVINVLSSFGLLSEVGKISLNMIRRAAEKKSIAEISKAQYVVSSDETLSVSAYKDVAKLAINHTINETIDDTLIGSAVGSYVGFKSVVFKSPEMTTTSKAVKAFMEKDNIPTIVEHTKVEAKVVAKEAKTEVAPKASTAKKTA